MEKGFGYVLTWTKQAIT